MLMLGTHNSSNCIKTQFSPNVGKHNTENLHQIMKHLILILLLLFPIILYPQDSKTDWKTDLEFLQVELPNKHYDFKKLDNYGNFKKNIDYIIKQSDSLSDIEIAIRLQQIIAKLGDSHSRVAYGKYINKKQILPLHLFWFKNGIFIIQTTKPNKEILGHKILGINGIPIQNVIDSISTMLTIDNEAIVKSYVPKLIRFIQLLQYFKITRDSTIELQLEDSNGIKQLFTLQSSIMNKENRVIFIPDSLAFCYKNEKAFFIDYYQPFDNIYYIQYNKCWGKELEKKYGPKNNSNKYPSFKDFEMKVFRTLNTEKIDKIAFDLRFNGGGNSLQGTKFIKELSKYLKKNPDKKIYVVLGRFTFSSAILNAMDFKRLTNATFVGEITGGKPNHFGEVRSFTLPSSGLRIQYSTKYFQRENENLNTLTPDYIIETTFEDFKNGVDPVYEWIINQ